MRADIFSPPGGGSTLRLVCVAGIDDIERVGSGRTHADILFVAPPLERWRDALERVAQRARTNRGSPVVSPARLTQREYEVMNLLRQDLSPREIAGRLFVTRRTVESHIARAYAKLGAHDRPGAIEALAAAEVRRARPATADAAG